MFALIRVVGYFIFSTLILSIPINSKPLFYSVQQYSTPVVTIVIKKAKDIYNDMISVSNDKSKIKNKIDQISSSLSGTTKNEFKNSKELKQRRTFFKTKKMVPEHAYKHEDSKMLKEILERE